MDMECLGSNALTTITVISCWANEYEMAHMLCDVMSDPNTLSYAILGTLSGCGVMISSGCGNDGSRSVGCVVMVASNECTPHCTL